MNGDEDDMIKMLHNFFTVSLNVSFATHPNYRECEDPTCSPVINKGITIKYDANMLPLLYPQQYFKTYVNRQVSLSKKKHPTLISEQEEQLAPFYRPRQK